MVKYLSDGSKEITDQQIQAVGVGLDVVGVFHGNSPEVLELGTSHLPDNQGERNHPFDTLLYVTPLITCQKRSQRLSPQLIAGLYLEDTLSVNSQDNPTYLRPSASTPARRNDTKQKQRGHHKEILSSQHPGHTGLEAKEDRSAKTRCHMKLLEAPELWCATQTHTAGKQKVHVPLRSARRPAVGTEASAPHPCH